MATDVLVLLTKSLLYVISYSALFIYAWWSFVFCLPTWSAVSRDGSTHSQWATWQANNKIKYHVDGGSEETLLSGSDLLAVLLWWVPLLVAVMCSFATAVLPKRANSTHSIRGDSVITQLKRTFSWQLPPRQLWQYCCDGLTVGEFGGVSVWIAAHGVALWNYVDYYQARANNRNGQQRGAPVSQSVTYLSWIALSFGWLSFIDFAFLFLPLSRNGFLTVLTGLSYPSLIRYHRWIGHSTMCMIALHGTFFYVYWIVNPNENFWEEFSSFKGNVNVLAGSISFFFGLLLWVTSLNFVRRKYFEVFYKTHLIGFLGFIVFGMMHYNGMWRIFVPGLVLYAADYVVRIVQGSSVVAVESSHVSEKDHVALIELPAMKGFSTCPAQDIFLLFPTISRWQWHPFTIMARKEGADPSKPGSVTVALKSYGNWTKEVMRQLSNPQYPVPIRVNGAFDGCSVGDIRGYDHLLLLGGGIGATPLIAVATEIKRLKACSHPAVAQLQRVHFLWVARTTDELSVVPEEILAMTSCDPWFSLELYYTGKEPVDGKHPPQAIEMKPILKAADLKPSLQEADVNLVRDVGDNATSSGVSHGNCCLGTTAMGTTAGGVCHFKNASPFFWNTARPAEPFGHLMTLLTVLVAFVGAFLGLVIAMACDLEWAEKSHAAYVQTKQNVLTLTCIVVQTIGLPMMLVVLPRHYFLASTKSAAPLTAKEPTVTEVATIQADGSIGYLESNTTAPITCGRPDIKALLEDFSNNGKARQICVCCAGPEALLKSTAMTVWNLNDKRQPSQPHISFKKYSYEL